MFRFLSYFEYPIRNIPKFDGIYRSLTEFIDQSHFRCTCFTSVDLSALLLTTIICTVHHTNCVCCQVMLRVVQAHVRIDV